MARDPYRYFRVEASELLDGLGQGVLELEKATAPDLATRLLRLAHTLKGAARVVKQPEIAELAHAAESLLARQRDTAEAMPAAQATELLGVLDRIRALLKVLEPSENIASGDVPREETLETLRVDIQDMNALGRSVSEVAVRVDGLRTDLAMIDRVRQAVRALVEQLNHCSAPSLSARVGDLGRLRSLVEEVRTVTDRLGRVLDHDVERVESGLAEVRDLTHGLRLVSARTVFSPLERAVRDAAESVGRQVDFEASGGDVLIDAHVLASLRGALLHVVRNAVAHGIETESERRARGKPVRGRIRLDVDRRGDRIAFVCRDDGAGVDLEAVRKAATIRGLVSPSDARTLASEQLMALLEGGGVTTSSRVTELAGRGIGLDVVRATTAQLKGHLEIRTERGRGVEVSLDVPMSIASLDALLVEVSGSAAVIPLDAVRRTLRVKDRDIARSGQSESILHEGKVIPFVPLERALRRFGPQGRQGRTWSAVVVRGREQDVAVGVDRLLGTSAIVLRPIPSVAKADRVVAGATFDAEGNPQLVLDPNGLLATATAGVLLQDGEPSTSGAPVLVVDDSLTTRMLEQSILESAGYEVDLATSAEEALVKARERKYGLFVVDVEMPGMDGFGFVAEVQRDPALSNIPAILVTSRDSAEDRRRGEQVGARAYIAKGDFDQTRLLKTIGRLMG